MNYLGVLQAKEVVPELLDSMRSKRRALVHLAHMRHPDARNYLLELYHQDPRQNMWTLVLLRLYPDAEIQVLIANAPSTVDPRGQRQLNLLSKLPIPFFARPSWGRDRDEEYVELKHTKQSFAKNSYVELVSEIQHTTPRQATSLFPVLVAAAKSAQEKAQAGQILSSYLSLSDAYIRAEALRAMKQLDTKLDHSLLFEIFAMELSYYSRDEDLPDLAGEVLLNQPLSAHDPIIEAGLHQASPIQAAKIRFLQADLLAKENGDSTATDELRQMLKEPLFQQHPSLALRAIHRLSDRLPAPERIEWLTKRAGALLAQFTDRELSYYPNAEYRNRVLLGKALLLSGDTKQARSMFEALWKEISPTSDWNNDFIFKLQFSIADSWLAEGQTESAIKHTLHGLRLMQDLLWRYRLYGGEDRFPYREEFQSQFEKLMGLLSQQPDRQNYFRESFYHPSWYPPIVIQAIYPGHW